MTEPLKTIIDRREAVIKILERDAQDAHDKLANAAPPVQVPNSIRVPLDSLHADAEYLLARLLAGTLTREQVVGVIRDRIDAARLEIEALRKREGMHRMSTLDGICLESTMSYALHQKITGTWDDKHYPELPISAGLVTTQEPITVGGWVKHLEEPGFTEDQLRAYADATCAMRAQADSQPVLPKITAEDRSLLHYNPNTDDIVEWVQRYASAAITADRAMRAQVAPAAVAVPVAYRVLRKRHHDGEWITDGRPWCDGVPTQDLVDDIALRSDGWRIEYAFAAPAAQAAPQPAVQQWNDLIGKETHADADGLLVWRDEVDFAIPTVQPAPAAQGWGVLPSLFREALAWGMTYGPEIPAHQWEEMRESMVEKFTARAQAKEGQAMTDTTSAAPVAQRDAWLEAAIAWEVCASIHRRWAKGKDAFYSIRQSDFQKHAEDARAQAEEGA